MFIRDVKCGSCRCKGKVDAYDAVYTAQCFGAQENSRPDEPRECREKQTRRQFRRWRDVDTVNGC